MIWEKRLFTFCMIYNFSKYDGFTVLQIISIKECAITIIASPLQLWLFDNKIASEKITTLIKGAFL